MRLEKSIYSKKAIGFPFWKSNLWTAMMTVFIKFWSRRTELNSRTGIQDRRSILRSLNNIWNWKCISGEEKMEFLDIWCQIWENALKQTSLIDNIWVLRSWETCLLICVLTLKTLRIIWALRTATKIVIGTHST